MSLEPRIGPGGRDDDVTRALRRLYAAPAGEEYWRLLEQRILARLPAEEDVWWQPLASWARAGLVAAGLALAVAGAALARSQAAQTRLVYEAVIATPRTVPLQVAVQASQVAEREATLQYVISP